MKTRGTWLIVAGIALAGSAIFGVFTAWLDNLAAEGSQPPRFAWLDEEIPPYPNAYFYPMGQQMHTNGLSREMGYAVTDDSPSKVADRYEAVWQSQGQPVERHSSDDREILIATDRADPVMRSVIASKADRGRTVIVASVSRKFERVGEQLIPVPDGCGVMVSHGARDNGIYTEMAMLRCELPLGEVLAYYDTLLAGTERNMTIEPTIDSKEAQVNYVDARVNVMLVATQAEDDPPLTVIDLTWQEQR